MFSLIIVFLSFFSTYVFQVSANTRNSPPASQYNIVIYDECLQAGLVGLLVARYKLPILVSVAYLSLSISYHVASLNTRWYQPQSYWWTDQLLALFVVHRSGGASWRPAPCSILASIFMCSCFPNGPIHPDCCFKSEYSCKYSSPLHENYFFLHPLMIIVSVSALYYYCYKRAGLSIADPRFYEDLSWVKEENLSR